MKQMIKKSMLVYFIMLVFIYTNFLPVKAEGEISTYKYVENVKSKKYEDFEYMYCDICDGIVIVKYIEKGKKVVVPNKINDIEVKEIKLYVKDIIGNRYNYMLEYSTKEEKIVGLKEI